MAAAAGNAEPTVAAGASAVEDESTTADLVEAELLLLPGTPITEPTAAMEDGAGETAHHRGTLLGVMHDIERSSHTLVQSLKKVSPFALKRSIIKTQAQGSRMVGGKKPRNETSYNSMESVNYTVPDTKREEAYMMELKPNARRFRAHFLWFLYGAIGITVSIVVLGTLGFTDWILKKRAYATKNQLASNNLVMAWLFWTGSSLSLCVVALAMVLIEPAAASSGIPGLLAFLNGVIPKGGKSPITGNETSFLSWQTMLSKLVGMLCSIPSGLAIGPEGPIIHICALIGYWVTVVCQRVEQRLLPGYYFTTDSAETRDFLAVGAACGICVAFRAPLAGCLFVVEEAGSFFSTRHLEYTFFACIVSYFVAQILANPVDGFTKFRQPTGFFCDSNFADLFDLAMLVVLALLGGLLGALFNQIVEHLSHLRMHHINPSALKRSLEVLLLVLATGSVAVLLPAAFPCQHATRALMMKDSIGCLSEADMHQISYGTARHERLAELLQLVENVDSAAELAELKRNLDLHKYQPDDGDEMAAGDAWKDAVLMDNQHDDGRGEHIHLHYSHAYTCNATAHEYNGMAMLWLNGGVKGVKVLMQRGFPQLLTWPVLLSFCGVYFVLAACTSGCSVPAGLVVPMLLVGGSFGRLVGVIGLEIKKNACAELAGIDDSLTTNSFFWSSTYRWIGRECNLPDPGVYAVVGMASFLGGSGRITVFLATMMVELTDDASLIAPVGFVCIMSMIVGNRFNHGLYHGLIPVFSLPFLNAEPAQIMYITRVCETMVHVDKIVSLPKRATVAEVRELVAKCDQGSLTHNAFPVVDSRIFPRLRGIVELDELRSALRSIQDTKDPGSRCVKLLDWADRSPITVYSHATVARAYDIFRKLGMRHMCVVDNSGDLVGLLTRKNLMTFTLDDSICRLKARAVLRGWVVRHRLAQHRDPLLGIPMSRPERMQAADKISAARKQKQSELLARPGSC